MIRAETRLDIGNHRCQIKIAVASAGVAAIDKADIFRIINQQDI